MAQETLEQEVAEQQATRAAVGVTTPEPVAVVVEEQYTDLPIVHYVDTPYTTAIVLGQGVYIQPLAPTDTATMRSLQPMTTEPAVDSIPGGFRTTNTKYVKVSS